MSKSGSHEESEVHSYSVGFSVPHRVQPSNCRPRRYIISRVLFYSSPPFDSREGSQCCKHIQFLLFLFIYCVTGPHSWFIFGNVLRLVEGGV